MVFLLVTLFLSLWLGLQALDAARSHRRTAEGALSDYARIAAWEYSRMAREGLDVFYRRLFDDIPRSVRRRPPHPEVMENDLELAVRATGCECRALLERAWFFRVDLRDSTVVSEPGTMPEPSSALLAKEISAHRRSASTNRNSLFVLGGGTVSDSPTMVVYEVARDWEDEDLFAYGVVADVDAFGELFLDWYRDATLLPTTVAESQPGDSLMVMSVLAGDEVLVFQSPVTYPRTFMARDTLEEEYGDLVVEAAIRPDAASHLIIGGLPRSRLPLLLGLMLLTLGVGAAALVQVRREHQLARLRDDFISGVSHEFRTPLTQIRVFAELLHDGKLKTDADRRRSSSVIDREARRLTHLVENILHFSRLQRPALPQADLEELDPGVAIDELTDAFARQAEVGNATIQTEVEPGLVVTADRSGLHR
ncbi:sensor histidine kinase, partial [Gemmatimonadota bacterium]